MSFVAVHNYTHGTADRLLQTWDLYLWPMCCKSQKNEIKLNYPTFLMCSLLPIELFQHSSVWRSHIKITMTLLLSIFTIKDLWLFDHKRDKTGRKYWSTDECCRLRYLTPLRRECQIGHQDGETTCFFLFLTTGAFAWSKVQPRPARCRSPDL